MGVYGNFLSAFPELYRRIEVWTKEDKSDVRTITGVYLPTKGDKLKRWQFSNRSGMSDYNSTAIDYSDDDQLYVAYTFRNMVHVGDYFYDPDENDMHRIMGEVDYSHPAGYLIFSTERVTGASTEHTEQLQVKEATFD